MNCIEIEQVISELSIKGAFIQNIKQVSFTTVIFECYQKSGAFKLLINLDPHFMRFHLSSENHKALSKPPRFTTTLKSKIKGCRINKIEQLNLDRIIKLSLTKKEEVYYLYIRLWVGGSNIFLCDAHNIIIDTFTRRPKKNESPGKEFTPPLPRDSSSKTYKLKEEFTLNKEQGERPLSYNQFLDTLYKKEESHNYQEETKTKLSLLLSRQLKNLKIKQRGLHKKKFESDKSEHYYNYGQILLTHLHLIKKGDPLFSYLENSPPLEIKLDVKLSPSENANLYFKRGQKAKKAAQFIVEDLALLEAQERELTNTLESIETLDFNQMNELLKSFGGDKVLKKDSSQKKQTQNPPLGLQFLSGSYKITVGRTAKENVTLLKKMKGNDFWLHVRDYPGAYVFIQSIKGKTIPLETLIDGGHLALHYSKAKKGGEGDIYYTQVKNLKRPKGAPLGQVIPSQEKNLFIRLDPQRIKGLKG